MLYQFHRDIFFFFLFVFFFFLHHLDLSVLPGQLLCIVYSRNRVSLEPSKFSMMAEIGVRGGESFWRGKFRAVSR